MRKYLFGRTAKTTKIDNGELKESDATSTHVPEDALLLDELLEHIVHEIDKNNEKTANVLKRRLFAQESYEKSPLQKNPRLLGTYLFYTWKKKAHAFHTGIL